MVAVMKGSLSAPRKRLVELMQTVNFGRLERVEVAEGEPVLDPAPAIVREWKFCSENGCRPERGATDFALKAQVLELFDLFDELGEGRIEVLEIKHGLPFRAMVRSPG